MRYPAFSLCLYLGSVNSVIPVGTQGIAPIAIRERPPLKQRAESSHPFGAWNPYPRKQRAGLSPSVPVY